jgi:hypothetical protein
LAGAGVDLSRPEIVIRPRASWEAADLGCLIARRWFGLIVMYWAAIALPVLVVAVIASGFRPDLALLIYWWGKPLYERLPLWALGQVIFGGDASWRALRGRWRTIVLPGIAGALTVFRLSPTRSFDAPVSVLERLGGGARAARVGVLRREGSGPALWVTVLGAHLELFLIVGSMTLVALLVPDQVSIDWFTLLTGPTELVFLWLLLALYVLVSTLVGPFYVAAGFSLYLHRRIDLEGWDVEIGFRQLLARFQQAQRGAHAVVVALCLAAVLGIASVPGAHATPDESRRAIDIVLEEPGFTETNIVYRRDREQGTSTPWMSSVWLAAFASVVMEIGRVLLWVIAIAGAIWLAIRVARHAGGFGRHAAVPASSARVTGQAQAARVTVEDPVEHARATWHAGDRRGAVSMLLLASVERLETRQGVNIRAGDTESDWLYKARRVAPEDVVAFLVPLIGLWQRLAYAHRDADAVIFDSICNRWPSTWR